MQRCDGSDCLLLHFLFNRAALAIETIELARYLGGSLRFLGQQALDAEGHVFQPAGGVQARRHTKTKVAGGEPSGCAAGHAQQRVDADAGAAVIDARQTLRHQNPVVVIQRHEVRHGAKGHEIKQHPEIRFREAAAGKPARFPQVRTQGQHEVKRHADAGEMFAGKGIARLVGIDDGIGFGKCRPRQMMVGNQHLDAATARLPHAVDAGDAVIDGNNQVRVLLCRQRHNLRRQAVAVFKTVGDHIAHIRDAHQP